MISLGVTGPPYARAAYTARDSGNHGAGEVQVYLSRRRIIAALILSRKIQPAAEAMATPAMNAIRKTATACALIPVPRLRATAGTGSSGATG